MVLTSETCSAVNWHNKASVIKLVYLYSNLIMNSSTDSTLIPRFSRVLVGTIPAKSKQSSKNKSPPPPKKKTYFGWQGLCVESCLSCCIPPRSFPAAEQFWWSPSLFKGCKWGYFYSRDCPENLRTSERRGMSEQVNICATVSLLDAPKSAVRKYKTVGWWATKLCGSLLASPWHLPGTRVC